MIYIRNSRNVYIYLIYRGSVLILHILQLISYKLEVFQLLTEIMRVEEKSFSTPRNNGGGGMGGWR
jgi:hypothetical protein